MLITPLVAGLFVFAMRVIDMSLDTLRLLFVMRGRKLLAGSIGVIQATVFILAVSAVLKGPLDPLTVAGYALGFGDRRRHRHAGRATPGAGPFHAARVFAHFRRGHRRSPAHRQFRRHRIHRAWPRRRNHGDQLGHRPPRHRQGAGHRQADRSRRVHHRGRDSAAAARILPALDPHLSPPPRRTSCRRGQGRSTAYLRTCVPAYLRYNAPIIQLD